MATALLSEAALRRRRRQRRRAALLLQAEMKQAAPTRLEEMTVQHFDLTHDDEEEWEREYFPMFTGQAACRSPSQCSVYWSAPLSSANWNGADFTDRDDDVLAMPDRAHEAGFPPPQACGKTSGFQEYQDGVELEQKEVEEEAGLEAEMPRDKEDFAVARLDGPADGCASEEDYETEYVNTQQENTKQEPRVDANQEDAEQAPSVEESTKQQESKAEGRFVEERKDEEDMLQKSEVEIGSGNHRDRRSEVQDILQQFGKNRMSDKAARGVGFLAMDSTHARSVAYLDALAMVHEMLGKVDEELIVMRVQALAEYHQKEGAAALQRGRALEARTHFQDGVAFAELLRSMKALEGKALTAGAH